MEISPSPNWLIPKIFASGPCFSQQHVIPSFFSPENKGKRIYSISNLSAIKNETYFNALIAKEAETCHKYEIKQAENFPGITNGWLLAQRPRLTTE